MGYAFLISGYTKYFIFLSFRKSVSSWYHDWQDTAIAETNANFKFKGYFSFFSLAPSGNEPLF